MKIRQIVKDAFKVDELVYQFGEIDVADGHLEVGSEKEVNEKYDDEYIIGEAKYFFDVALTADEGENFFSSEWKKDAKQLRRFIKKWG